GLFDRPAVQIVTGGTGGGGSIHDGVTVVAGDANPGERDPQRVGRQLGNLGVQALAHLHAAVLDEHGPVRDVDVDEGAGGVEGAARLRVGDAILLGDHRDPPLPPAARPVEFLNRLFALLEVRRLVQAIPDLADITEVQV